MVNTFYMPTIPLAQWAGSWACILLWQLWAAPRPLGPKKILSEKLMELGASYCLPKVEGESLADAHSFAEHLNIGHFGASIPLPSRCLSAPDKLTALDLAVTDTYHGVPPVGIYIGDSSGVSRAELGYDAPDLLHHRFRAARGTAKFSWPTLNGAMDKQMGALTLRRAVLNT